MDSHTLIKEIKLFLNENKKFIFLSALIVVIMAVLIQLASFWIGGSNEQNFEDENGIAMPAEFKVYIENEATQTPFINSYLIEEIFEQPENVSLIEKNTDIPIKNVIEEFKEMNPDTSYGDPLKPITTDRHKSTQIMTIRFNIGEEEQNLIVAKAYYNLLFSGDLQMFEGKKLYSISEPQIMLPKEDSTISSDQSFSLVSFIISIVLGLFGGIIIGFIISLILAMINKKIKYAFTYDWDEDDIFLSYKNKKIEENELILNVFHPKEESKVILYDQTNDLQKIDYIKKIISRYQKEKSIGREILISESISEINPLINIGEFIFIIERNNTTKEWYKKQRALLKNYPTSSVKIIQL